MEINVYDITADRFTGGGMWIFLWILKSYEDGSDYWFPPIGLPQSKLLVPRKVSVIICKFELRSNNFSDVLS